MTLKQIFPSLKERITLSMTELLPTTHPPPPNPTQLDVMLVSCSVTTYQFSLTALTQECAGLNLAEEKHCERTHLAQIDPEPLDSSQTNSWRLRLLNV